MHYVLHSSETVCITAQPQKEKRRLEALLDGIRLVTLC